MEQEYARMEAREAIRQRKEYMPSYYHDGDGGKAAITAATYVLLCGATEADKALYRRAVQATTEGYYDDYTDAREVGDAVLSKEGEKKCDQ